MGLRAFANATLAVALATSAAACGHLPAHHKPPGTSSANMQGQSMRAWAEDPHMRSFYELSVAAFANGADKVDVPAYEQKAYAIFRSFGAAIGWSPEAMQDHLKGIPRQMVQIVKDDPKTLDSLENFKLAVFGPE